MMGLPTSSGCTTRAAKLLTCTAALIARRLGAHAHLITCGALARRVPGQCSALCLSGSMISERLQEY
jgi:uncharacterized membrane protein YjjB (DUF3815 family)